MNANTATSFLCDANVGAALIFLLTSMLFSFLVELNIAHQKQRKLDGNSQIAGIEGSAIKRDANAASPVGEGYYRVIDIECDATIEGDVYRRSMVQISTRSLPKEGEFLRAMCKCTWPKITANGWKDQEPHYRWAEVRVAQGDIFIKEIST